jgi:hypothetical protein
MLAVVRTSFITFVFRYPSIAVRPGHYPIGAIGVLNSLPSPPLRLWHEWNWGGYLSFGTQGRVKIFADGRLVLYGRDLLIEQLVMVKPKARIEKEAFLARHGVQALVVPPGMWARGEPWFRVWASDQSEIYLHRERARGHLHWMLARLQARGVRVLGVDRARAEDAIARGIQSR